MNFSTNVRFIRVVQNLVRKEFGSSRGSLLTGGIVIWDCMSGNKHPIQFAGFAGLSAKRFGPVLNWIFKKYTVPATYGARIISSETMPKIPVLIFSHGLGGTKQCYSTVCCELASQGFIVGAVEHRDGSASFSYSVESFLRFAKLNAPYFF